MIDDTTLTSEQVRIGYRLLLNREPESAQVLEEKLRSHHNLSDLRTALLSSEEYKTLNGVGQDSFSAVMSQGYSIPGLEVEYQANDELTEKLTQRIREQWRKLGEEEPFWSVLTDDSFKSKVWNDAAQDSFRASGLGSAALIDLTASRTGLTARRGTCLELGCGVGRITRFLADRFDRVIAVDISPGNLSHCEAYMAEENITNVEPVLIRDVSDLTGISPIDYFFSVIVLQHNPPPIQYKILDTVLSLIRPGGQCLFQTVADMPNYHFNAEEYLSTESPVMEIHSLPMAAILRLLQSYNFVIDTVRMDYWVDTYGSYTFSAHRA